MWFGHLISHAGDAVFMIALPWLMLDITGSKSLTALVSMSAYLPAVIFGLTAGVVVDRYNRKWIMIYSDILRTLLVSFNWSNHFFIIHIFYIFLPGTG